MDTLSSPPALPLLLLPMTVVTLPSAVLTKRILLKAQSDTHSRLASADSDSADGPLN